MTGFAVETRPLPDGRGTRARLRRDGAPLSFGDVLALWRDSPEFARFFSSHLAEQPVAAFRWETPGRTAAERDALYEHVVIADPSLAGRRPAPEAFADALEALAPGETAARFPNLGGDAVLIAPAPLADPADCVEIAAFCRAAPEDRSHGFWRAVAEATLARLSERRVWLSTAGGGVAWLHARLDDRPKYYAHAPYRGPAPGP
ncbi:MAG: hypothetical protein AAFW46_05580 [Pseudomonadota bacterium]